MRPMPKGSYMWELCLKDFGLKRHNHYCVHSKTGSIASSNSSVSNVNLFCLLQQLDQLQSLELFQCFLLDAYHGSLADLQTKLGSKREREKLLGRLRQYYYLERLHLLHCLKHLYSYWQNSSHPYRVCVTRNYVTF